MSNNRNRTFTNWAGNVKFQYSNFFQPGSEAEIVDIIKQAAEVKAKVRVVGAAHSWSPIMQSPDFLINLDKFNKVIHIDEERKQVTVQSGIRLYDLNAILWENGLSMSNLGTINKQSIAGAISTGTHGSGISFGNISTQIIGASLIKANGDIIKIDQEENTHLLPAIKVSLGALGILSTVTIQCEEAFYLKEESFPVSFEEGMETFEDHLNSVEHFKMWWFVHAPKVQFYRWYRSNDKLKPRNKIVAFLEDKFLTNHFFGFLLKVGTAMPALIPPINKFINLVHFKKIDRVEPGHDIFSIVVPPKHWECEYAIPVEHAKEAILAYKKLIKEKKFKVNFVVEIRFVKGDDIWMSPCYGRNVCYLAAYQHNTRRWDEFLDYFEELMSKYDGRPHWGKQFNISGAELKKRYPKWDDFEKIMKEMDPEGMFQNDMLRQLFKN